MPQNRKGLQLWRKVTLQTIEGEQERYKKVAAAYTELYELESIWYWMRTVRFVKLQYYTPEYGFNDVITYTDSEKYV